MNMRIAAEVPDHRRTFDLPHVPDAVLANVLILVKRHVQVLEAVLLDQLHRFVGVGFAKRREQIGDDLADEFTPELPERPYLIAANTRCTSS
jgi:hypothetical protein